MSTLTAGRLFGIPPMPVRKFTVAEYHRMIDAGILTEDDNVELLEGWIVPKMARKPPHDGTVQVTNNAVVSALPAGWTVRTQCAITTSDSEPEPDLAIVRGNERTYMHRHPQPPDIGTLIEVSDATLGEDRRDKGRLYAHAQLPCHWIVNLKDGWVEVYTDPDSSAATPHYRNRKDYHRGDTVPLILDGQVVASLLVDDLLP